MKIVWKTKAVHAHNRTFCDFRKSGVPLFVNKYFVTVIVMLNSPLCFSFQVSTVKPHLLPR